MIWRETWMAQYAKEFNKHNIFCLSYLTHIIFFIHSKHKNMFNDISWNIHDTSPCFTKGHSKRGLSDRAVLTLIHEQAISMTFYCPKGLSRKQHISKRTFNCNWIQGHPSIQYRAILIYFNALNIVINSFFLTFPDFLPNFFMFLDNNDFHNFKVHPGYYKDSLW